MEQDKSGRRHCRFFLPSSFIPLPSGFTLIELALVSAAIGILLVATVPRFQQKTQQLRAEQGAFALAQSLRYARERAIVEGKDVRWTWDEVHHGMTLEALDGAEAAVLTLPAGARATLPEGAMVTVTREEAPIECRCLLFAPDGTSGEGSGPPTDIHLTVQRFAYDIAIDAPTGRVTLTQGPAPR